MKGGTSGPLYGGKKQRTVTYAYNGNNLIATKTDAKGQLLTYAYDGYNRLTSVTWTNASGGAQVLRTYYYDTNPLDPTGMFSQYALGRLTAVQYPQFATNVQMNDMYSYSRAGLPAAKRLQVNQLVAYDDINNRLQHQTVTANLDSIYAYNDEGQVTAMTYPSTIGVLNVVTPGPSYNYSYDGMNRLGGMTDSNNNTIVNGVSYDQANRLLTMAFSNVNEHRNYNVLGQLTQIWAPNIENIAYNYPSGTNNGKVSSMYNVVSGETVTYTYDSLNRLATAAGSGWGEAYTLDPYGNLTTKQVTSGSGPSLSVSVNPGNNQLQGYGFNYDANGNAINSSSATPLAYDAENRVSAVGWSNNPPVVDYSYDAQNKRIFMWTAGTLDSFSNVYNYSVVFYSPSGQKLGTYLLAPQQPVFQPNGINTPYVTVSRVSSDQYFGGRRLAAMDQLGSAGTYYPWGEAKGSTNPQDTWSYATYWRDSATGLDYANNRYYSNAYGRFMTPDPSSGSAHLTVPESWNRYAYVTEDPINSNDPTGLTDVVIAGITNSPGDGSIDQFATSIGAIEAFPYAGGSLPGGILAVAGLTLQQAAQAATVVDAIEAAAADSSGPIDIFAFSGGAAAFENALQLLPPSIVARIDNVVYASPGDVGSLPTVNGLAPTVVFGNGPLDWLATSTVILPGGTDVINTNCVGHNASCEFATVANLAGSHCNQCSAFYAPNLGLIAQIWATAQQMAYAAVWGTTNYFSSFNYLDYLDLIYPNIAVVTSTITYGGP